MKFLKVGGALAVGVAGWLGGAQYERLVAGLLFRISFRKVFAGSQFPQLTA
jgi:hypothetical protein